MPSSAKRRENRICSGGSPRAASSSRRASREWFGSKIPTVAIDTIEDYKTLLTISALKELETRNSLRIKCDNLTIENQRSVSKLTHCVGCGQMSRSGRCHFTKEASPSYLLYTRGFGSRHISLHKPSRVDGKTPARAVPAWHERGWECGRSQPVEEPGLLGHCY
jgi:hypothetical protein